MAERPTRERIEEIRDQVQLATDLGGTPSTIAIDLLAEIDALRAELDAELAANDRSVQGLGRALGYPEVDGRVNIQSSSGLSLIDEVAQLRAENERMIEPCAKCGGVPNQYVTCGFQAGEQLGFTSLGCCEPRCNYFEEPKDYIADWNATQRKSREGGE